MVRAQFIQLHWICKHCISRTQADITKTSQPTGATALAPMVPGGARAGPRAAVSTPPRAQPVRACASHVCCPPAPRYATTIKTILLPSRLPDNPVFLSVNPKLFYYVMTSKLPIASNLSSWSILTRCIY